MRALLFVLVLVFAGTGACKQKPPELERDAKLAQSVAAGVEAREWCDRPNVMGFQVSVADMRDLADEAYQRGARKVWVTGISELQGKEIAAVMVVELPVAEATRAELFGWYNATFHEDDAPERDVGQAYLELVLD